MGTVHANNNVAYMNSVSINVCAITKVPVKFILSLQFNFLSVSNNMWPLPALVSTEVTTSPIEIFWVGGYLNDREG